MPLTLIEAGKACRVRAVGGSDAVRRHLGDMGFVAGANTDYQDQTDAVAKNMTDIRMY